MPCPTNAIQRICTTCGLQGHNGIPATHVATSPNKIQWFECPNHEDWEHAYELRGVNKTNLNLEDIRCALVPIDTWLKTLENEQQQYSTE